jgi:CRP-like cAMP-binding protein
MRRDLTDAASSRLFAGFRKDEIALITAAAARRTFQKSETIIHADQPATRLFLIAEGQVDYFVVTSHGQEILLRRLVTGEVFGVAAFLHDPLGYLGTAKPAPSVEVLEWKHEAVLQLARDYPRLPENALRGVLQYIALYAKRHARLVANTAEERLASVVAGLASRAGHVLPGGVEVEIKNEDLASLADTSPFTTSRVLNQWEREGAVEKSRGKVLLRCPEKLIA